VVVGVRRGDTGFDTGVEPCAEVCTGANVTAWAEARAASGGWVVLDATPQFAEAPSTVSPSEEPPQNPTVPREPAAGVLDPPAAASDDRSSSETAETAETNWLDAVLPIVVTVAVSVLALALLALPLLVFPIAKAARRRWRRSASSEVAVVGAWHELLDHYIDYRQPVPRGLTRTETADAVRHPSALGPAGRGAAPGAARARRTRRPAGVRRARSRRIRRGCELAPRRRGTPTSRARGRVLGAAARRADPGIRARTDARGAFHGRHPRPPPTPDSTATPDPTATEGPPMTPLSDAGPAIAAVIGLLIWLLVAVGLYLWYAFALAKLFPKLGAESWKGWVPVLNDMEILVRGGVPGWSIVFAFIPFVSFYYLYLRIVAAH